MKVLVLDDNLLWTQRLTSILRSGGHEVTSGAGVPEAEFEVAVVNVSSSRTSPFDAISALVARKVWVLAHAGHKETHLREKAVAAGCSRFASNREVTTKLLEILGEADAG